MEFNLLPYVEWSRLGDRLCDEYTDLIPLVHSFRFGQLCFSLDNDDLAGVSRPSHLSNSTGAGTRAISALWLRPNLMSNGSSVSMAVRFKRLRASISTCPFQTQHAVFLNFVLQPMSARRLD